MRRITVAVVVGALALGASACGGSSTDAADAGSGTDASSASPTLAAETTSPTEAPSISPAHAAEPGEPELIQVEGYAYEPANSAVEKETQDMVAGMSYVFADASVHGVSQDGELVGVLVQSRLTPKGEDLMDRDPDAWWSSGTGSLEKETIAGEDVWFDDGTADGSGVGGYAWSHGDTISFYVTNNPEAAEAFVAAYLAEANG